jgi:hypothetical protein
MRLASGLRLLPCTAACLRSTAGPVATARPCRPTTLHLRDNSMVVQPTPTPCSARVPVHSRSGGILVYLSPISILLSQVQGPEPLRPERSRTKENTLFPPRWEPSRDTSCVVPTTYLPHQYLPNQYYISLCRLVRVQPVLYQPLQARTCPPVLYQPLQASVLYQPLQAQVQYYIGLCRLQYCISLCRHRVPVLYRPLQAPCSS